MQYQSHVQKQTQTLKILPQQIQFLNLLHLNTLELENHIQRELEENPFLEINEESDILQAPAGEESTSETSDSEDDGFESLLEMRGLDDEIPDYNNKVENGYDSDEPYQAPVVQLTDVREELKAQCLFLPIDERLRTLCAYIIDSLDDSGFLTTDLETLADDISFSRNMFFSEEELTDALTQVQLLDPPGLGARNLQECILIQLHRHQTQGFRVDLPLLLVQDHMDALATHEYDSIKKILQVSDDDLRYAVDYIRDLNPRPLHGFSDSSQADTERIIPEYIVEIDGNDISVTLANGRAEVLKISEGIDDMLQNTRDKKAKQFIRKKMEDANWIIEALRQRDDTMLRVMRVLAIMQHDFFLSGDTKKLKPMILRDVAAYVNLDISTVSRVTSSKYVQTPFGIFNLKDLFTHTFSASDGREISNQDVQDCLQEIIEAEDKTRPLSDSELCKVLKDHGFPVARRTVTKYRELLQIPIATLRRDI